MLKAILLKIISLVYEIENALRTAIFVYVVYKYLGLYAYMIVY